MAKPTQILSDLFSTFLSECVICDAKAHVTCWPEGDYAHILSYYIV